MTKNRPLSKFGLGTWGIGGFAERDPNNDDKTQIEALRYTLDNGINYIDTCVMYGAGYSLQVIKNALRGYDRDTLFINAKLTGTIEKSEDVEEKTDVYLKELDLEYLDAIQLHAPWRSKIPLEKTFDSMAKLVDRKKARFLSVSNCIPSELDLYRKVTGMPLFANEIDYNFEVRIHDTLGTVKNAQDHGTRIISLQPLRRGATAKKKYPLLLDLAGKYGKTQNQILLNWLMSKKLFLPIVKSSDIRHIDENLGSLGFNLSSEDVERMDRHTIDFTFPKPDISLSGDGIRVSNFSLYLSEHEHS